MNDATYELHHEVQAWRGNSCTLTECEQLYVLTSWNHDDWKTGREPGRTLGGPIEDASSRSIPIMMDSE